MNLVTKVLAGLLVALLVLGGVQTVRLHLAKAEAASAKLEAKTSKASADALGKYIDKSRQTDQAAATAKGNLDAALNANRDWSSTPVPDDVWDSLFHDLPAASGSAAN